MTVKSLHSLDRLAASSDSSSHSSVQEWLQTSESTTPLHTVAESIAVSAPQPSLPLSAAAAMMAPHSARTSRASHSTRRTRRGVASPLAAELFAFSREMSGRMMTMMGQFQAQAEAQRLDAKQREDAERAEAMKMEELLIQMKINSDQTSAERDKMQAEINQKRQQLFVESELKRQKMLIEANTSPQQEN